MFFQMIVKVALKCLLANVLRSVLAMLGIVIGVGAVISMLAIGAGAQQQLLERLTALGKDLLIVRPGQRSGGGVKTTTQITLVLDDATALLDNFPQIKLVAPAVNGGVTVKYGNNNARTTLIGATGTYFAARDFQLDKGRLIEDRDCASHARVAVIAPQVMINLFPPEIDPIGKYIKVNNVNYQVIGTIKAKGDQGWFNPDDQVFVPVTTAMKQVYGITYLRELDIQAYDGVDTTKLQDQVSLLLRKRHRVQASQPDDVEIRNQAEMVETFQAAQRMFTTLLGCIASISLLVGGIGIMNIMLVTVTERTREIGVRKAIGAREGDILLQFLIEAVLLSGIGGLLGVFFGIAAAWLVSWLWPDFHTIISPASIALSLTVACAIGVCFGFFPAWRASSLDPIDALRYE